MKKAAALLSVLLTFYLAGMYRDRALMALALAELLLGLLLYAQSRYALRGTEVSFARRFDETRVREPFVCRVRVTNGGIFGIPLVRVRLSARTPEESGSFLCRGFVPGRGEAEVSCTLGTNRCGLVELSLEWVRAGDILGVFCSEKLCGGRMELAVYPPRRALRIRSGAGQRDEGEDPMRLLGRASMEPGEIRQLREYRPGDPLRFIHWNQTARMEELWIREFEEQEEPRAVLMLDLRGLSQLNGAEREAFYELASGLMRGLTAKGALAVYWRDGAWQSRTLLDAEEEREVLLALYRQELAGAAEDGEEEAEEPAVPARELHRLNVKLEWRAGDRLIHRFRPESLSGEMDEMEFVV